MKKVNHCETCDHKKNPEGGHCYMFKEEPLFHCMQHTLYRVAIKPEMSGASILAAAIVAGAKAKLKK